MQRFLGLKPLNSLYGESASRTAVRTTVDRHISKNHNGFKKKAGILLFLVALTAFALPIMVSAQSVSGVTGVVTDSTGAVVPGAAVTLTDTRTARELTTKSDDKGGYSFQNVVPGQGYKLTFSIKGFQTMVLSDVTLGVAKTETYNATLTAGDVSATVDVVAYPDPKFAGGIDWFAAGGRWQQRGYYLRQPCWFCNGLPCRPGKYHYRRF